jgi:cytosine/adenosine deaminase-related metal-dependent hydrolase
MAIHLINGTYIDWQTIEIKLAHIRIFPGVDAGIEFLNDEALQDVQESNDIFIDCKGKLITKSFACGHHHVYSALARGMPPPSRTPENFSDILNLIWWRLDKCLDLDMIKASALYTAMQCAKNGVTFVFDHHASPNAVRGSLETIAEAFNLIGVSHLLCYELSNRDGNKSAGGGLEETEDYLQKQQGLVGLHASFTVGNKLLRDAVDLAQKHDSGIHVHVAEDFVDQKDCLKKYGCRVIERLRDASVLASPKSILAHCLHLDENERAILADSPAWIAQNTESNLNNNVGAFDGRGFSNILLGTDGMHSDMLRSAEAAYFSGQKTEAVSQKEIYRRFRNVHHYLSQNRFTGDSDNNLVILDYDSPTEINQTNFLSHFIYGLESRNVEHVISQGRLIVQNRELLTVDKDEILGFSKAMAARLWQEMQKH